LNSRHLGCSGFTVSIAVSICCAFYGQCAWQKRASGGKVCHLESRLRMRFAPRSSGQITSAYDFRCDMPVFIHGRSP